MDARHSVHTRARVLTCGLDVVAHCLDLGEIRWAAAMVEPSRPPLPYNPAAVDPVTFAPDGPVGCGGLALAPRTEMARPSAQLAVHRKRSAASDRTTSSPQKNEPIMVLVRPASTGH